jgi:Domain of unknown function (DUF4232)
VRDVGEATGQNTLAMRLTNRRTMSCLLDGYPVLALYDSHGRIPFTIYHGGDQMVTSGKPSRVVVAPGRTGVIVINKYRCDIGTKRITSELSIGLSGVARKTIAYPPGHGVFGYCGSGDPGSTISVSPFEPSLRDALSH